MLNKKYGGVAQWTVQRNKRLLSWGFNVLGEYHEDRGLPVGVYGGQQGSPVRLPFIVFPNVLLQAYNSPSRFGMADPLKNIVAGVSPKYYNAWHGRFLDIYDPHTIDAYRGALKRANATITGGFASQSWALGITPDDADVMFAFKGGPKGKVNKYVQPVYLIAIAKFFYTAGDDQHYTSEAGNNKREYKDGKLYSKYAWVDFLKKKYGTIAALNSAWGSNYATFDDDGGYGEGKGLLDEDGRHQDWLGSDFYSLSDAKPAVRDDMNAFLYEFARHYAETMVKAIREVDHHHLIFSPIALNSWGARAREQALKGMADGGIDAFFVSFDPVHPDLTGNNQTYDITGRPAMVWYGVNANEDSAMHGQKPIYGAPNFDTQQKRGEAYARDLDDFYNAQGNNGDHYILGIDFWELVDNPHEKTNWGLITTRDNAYDGKEAVRAAGKNAAGFATGGEDQDYGDFLSAVTNANFGVQDRLERDLGSQPAAGKQK